MSSTDSEPEAVDRLGTALHCRGLSLRFGSVQALDGLDLDIAPGESVGIVGRNGAGKSTLFRCIVGTELPDAGSVRCTPGLSRVEFLSRTGFVPDALSAYDWMTAGQAIDYVAALQPRFDAAWSAELTRLLAVDRSAKVRTLSRGMQARLAFVLGLSHRPELVLLDEPLLGVDAVTHDAVLETLARMRSELGATMLIASHQLGDIARLTDRVVFIDRGRVAESIATDELVSHTVRIVARGLPRTWMPDAGVIHARWQQEVAVLTVHGDLDDIAAVERGILGEHPEARLERVALSIHEACADRLRAMEVQS
jgi:ABC-2 type transport system ATP-binding protein